MTVKNQKTVSSSLQKADIKIGSEVEIPSLQQVGTILSDVTKNDTVQFQIGSLKTYL